MLPWMIIKIHSFLRHEEEKLKIGGMIEILPWNLTLDFKLFNSISRDAFGQPDIFRLKMKERHGCLWVSLLIIIY